MDIFDYTNKDQCHAVAGEKETSNKHMPYAKAAQRQAKPHQPPHG
ncbi:MAG: hypothetical protein OEZ39_18910 [Gammaproteobacteria bacterium]|nr:hypothetical protein [Gammaproteobacteria bacterium]MDH5653936.1 hypothetical protein [Gammaproteobacteria bacterium]